MSSARQPGSARVSLNFASRGGPEAAGGRFRPRKLHGNAEAGATLASFCGSARGVPGFRAHAGVTRGHRRPRGARAAVGGGDAPLILTVVLSSVAQQVWFKNRRAKWRRQKRSSSEESENAEKWNKTSSKASPEKREEEGKSDLDSDS